MGHYVEKQVMDKSLHLSDQLAAFSRIVAADREFSMKLLVENNRSAPEVTEIAPRFMEPMGLSTARNSRLAACAPVVRPVSRKCWNVRGRQRGPA